MLSLCGIFPRKQPFMHWDHFQTSTHITTITFGPTKFPPPTLLKPSPINLRSTHHRCKKKWKSRAQNAVGRALWTCPCKPFRSNVRARDLTVNNIMKVYTHKNCKKEGGKASLKVKGDGLGFPLDFQVFFFQIHFFLTRITRSFICSLKFKNNFRVGSGSGFRILVCRCFSFFPETSFRFHF